MIKNTQEKKKFKEILTETKQDLLVAVKDKKRWLKCLIEICIAAALVAIDLITKKYVYGACETNGKINIIEGVLSFTAVKNTGAGFGIFSDKTMLLTVISLICSVVLFLFIFYSYNYKNLWLRSALILILAGAVGNIVDRFALGYVRDFIYFELINFAVFNFADSCLTVGTIVLVIYIIFFYTKEEKKLRDGKKCEQVAESENKTDETEE